MITCEIGKIELLLFNLKSEYYGAVKTKSGDWEF
jgi:hypothetical protein